MRPRTKTGPACFLRRLSNFFTHIGVLTYLLMAGMCMTASPVQASDTLLMFVGEDLDILSLASRREEAAWKAPAIAEVVTTQRIDASRYSTLANLLEKSTGFYINQTERGSVPYLRGIPDSVLFLHDTVPMGSVVSKSNRNLDSETSLAAVKRVEIIRGAGSVLWGPDAFAGVVNMVPFTGRDVQGATTGAGLSSGRDEQWAFLNYGMDNQDWNGFVSISAKNAGEDDNAFNVTNFWNDEKIPAGPEERFGNDTPGDSHYYEMYSNISIGNHLSFSTRLSDNQKAWTLTNGTGDYTWEEKSAAPTRIFKLEAARETGFNSGLRFTGYYTDTDTDLYIIDKTFRQSETSMYAEMIHDQGFFTGNGLLTTGISWRKNSLRNILIWKSFFPDYLDEENTFLLPLYETADYDNTLTSIFGQYRHRFAEFEIWAGLRNDDHDQFKDKLSYNLGFVWEFSTDMMLKAIYGTAYRTPFAEQVAQGINSSQEQINSASVQLAWKSGTGWKTALTFFRNGIHDHVIEDRYSGAGLSTPNSQIIYGAELDWDIQLSKTLSFAGNFTRLANRGSDETYHYGRYAYKDIAGETVQGFSQTLNYAYDAGAETMANLSLAWQPTPSITVGPSLRYISETIFHYLDESDPDSSARESTVACPDIWLMDVHVKLENFFPFSVDFFIENLWNEKITSPGIYTLNSNKTFNAGVICTAQW